MSNLNNKNRIKKDKAMKYLKLICLFAFIHQMNNILLPKNDVSEIPSATKKSKKFFPPAQNTYSYAQNIPLSNTDHLPLWIAVNINNKIHVLINNPGSGLNVGNDWTFEYTQNTMNALMHCTRKDFEENAIAFSLITVPNQDVYVYIQWTGGDLNGEVIGYAKLENIKGPLKQENVIWSGSFMRHPPTLSWNTTFIFKLNTNIESPSTVCIPPFPWDL